MTDLSGVAKEIERKFLLSSLPPRVKSAESYRIVHGWIPGEVIQERITWNSRGDGEYWRVIKTGRGIERIEAQERITKDLHTKLTAACADRQIDKVRYYVPENGLVWEIDQFHGKNDGLFLAEIEIPTQDHKVLIPNWLQPYIVKEVTEDPQYFNINLAK